MQSESCHLLWVSSLVNTRNCLLSMETDHPTLLLRNSFENPLEVTTKIFRFLISWTVTQPKEEKLDSPCWEVIMFLWFICISPVTMLTPSTFTWPLLVPRSRSKKILIRRGLSLLSLRAQNWKLLLEFSLRSSTKKRWFRFWGIPISWIFPSCTDSPSWTTANIPRPVLRKVDCQLFVSSDLTIMQITQKSRKCSVTRFKNSKLICTRNHWRIPRLITSMSTKFNSLLLTWVRILTSEERSLKELKSRIQGIWFMCMDRSIWMFTIILRTLRMCLLILWKGYLKSTLGWRNCWNMTRILVDFFSTTIWVCWAFLWTLWLISFWRRFWLMLLCSCFSLRDLGMSRMSVIWWLGLSCWFSFCMFLLPRFLRKIFCSE